ncbi:hypothetical protein CDAR_593671 [Caerostris darwini]|uniref:Uncharacterized protein n=1 Tax=Caerostris darwini TaxID=1538125 RepID=A0AAV4VPZ9_9ARAC|nr:hypothetical protein CDAR_593671 [Caerostris darwini]
MQSEFLLNLQSNHFLGMGWQESSAFPKEEQCTPFLHKEFPIFSLCVGCTIPPPRIASQPPWPLARALPKEHHEEVGYSSSSPPSPPIEETCYGDANIFGDIVVLRSVIQQRATCCGISADGSESRRMGNSTKTGLAEMQSDEGGSSREEKEKTNRKDKENWNRTTTE